MCVVGIFDVLVQCDCVGGVDCLWVLQVQIGEIGGYQCYVGEVGGGIFFGVMGDCVGLIDGGLD